MHPQAPVRLDSARPEFPRFLLQVFAFWFAVMILFPVAFQLLAR